MPLSTPLPACMPPSAPSFTPSFRIIVIPPAEDLQPDYLVFEDDPREPELDSRPDCASLDDALAHLPSGESAPVFDRSAMPTVVMPRRGERDIGDDSEIVEVVKLGRRKPQEEEEEPKTRSLSWASRAFRSIKNIGRKPYAQEVFAASQTTFTAIPRPVTPPPLARRRSATLSELFRTPTQEVPSTSSTLSTLQFLAGESEDDGDDDEDQDERRGEPSPRASSPSPSTRTFSSSIRRRFSILNFRKARAVPRPYSPPALSRESTVPSTSSSLPQTPTDETCFHSPTIPKDADDDPDRTIGEMRLDSLHFDSLSFDADNF
ncbi:hypothetical protein FB45DRAFT_912354 [Roridomyces roridus]|uniref:Uncharacterized protein n=1 Tax=Roridomyces roridus TaxID=1738132 RepID=A0AAD7FQC3_9AGAR|nr:hypothetical protein FB45DRAFT_912354 [Roridomyces roridus]